MSTKNVCGYADNVVSKLSFTDFLAISAGFVVLFLSVTSGRGDVLLDVEAISSIGLLSPERTVDFPWWATVSCELV